jgi:beta-glucosidase
MLRIRDLTNEHLAFGVATSSYQIEGGVHADGRGRSIWDTFAATPGAVDDGTDGSVACDSYHRLDDDLAVIFDLGVPLYRFSVAWPRVQPDGRGPVNAAGLDYYERLVDGLLGHDVTPLLTLYHWDLPQPLEDAGGWPNRDTADRFADYAVLVHDRLGDRVGTWTTHNEPWCAAFLGYAAGVHAPGRREPAAAYAAAHHLLLGHGLAARALRAADPGLEIGIVLNLSPAYVDQPGAEEAAQVVDLVQNRLWLDALLHGHYPAALVARVPELADPTLVRDGDLATIAAPLDWMGVNYYTPFRVGLPQPDAHASVGQATDAYPGAPACSFRPRPPLTTMGWEVHPDSLRSLLVDVSREAAGVPLMVTENGVAYPDTARADDGSVVDDDRVAYLRDHITAVRQAQAEGADVRGYVAWSLMDNFEWGEGYTQLFGLVAVDPGTLRRVPKRSYRYFQELVRSEPVSPG